LKMNSFLLVACIVVCCVLLFIVLGMRWANSNKLQSAGLQSSARLAVFKDRKRELDADFLAGRVSQGEAQVAIDELSTQLQREASDLIDAPQAIPEASPRLSWAWAIGLLVPAIAIGLASYLFLGAPELTEQSFRDSFTKDTQQSSDAQNKQPDLEALKQLSIDKPTDASVWGSLGRGYRLANNYPDAVTAYAKAKALGLNSAEFLVDYAESIAASKRGDFSGEPVAMLAQALKLSPDLPKAIALMGAAQYRLGNFSEAKIYLKRTLDALPAGSEQAAAVQGAIDQISAAQSGKQSGAGPAMSFTGSIGVSPALKDQLSALPSTTAAMFVAVRTPERPMPIAAIKIAIADAKAALSTAGQIDFTIDEKNLLPGGSFGDQKSLIVVARISPTGSATRAVGDLTGSSQPFFAKSKNLVSFTVDTVSTSGSGTLAP
jgi:cytochrome c-type biogenesis protein CcmH